MGDLSTPDSVQKLQAALHAKAKAEPGYRFYALYDKISREDILAHAYAQCRSNKGAPGVDRQDFEAVETYGVEQIAWQNWRLRSGQETYRPGPYQTRFHTEGQRQTPGRWASPTLRDRVCMTAAMLVLEPIFEADLCPSELYAYRRGRKRPTGGDRGGGACVSCQPDRRSARAESDQDLAGRCPVEETTSTIEGGGYAP